MKTIISNLIKISILLITVFLCFTATASASEFTVLLPTVDIKANNSNGPITIDYNTSAVLSWTSTDATSCYASGYWMGSKGTSGSESTGLLTSSKTYTITCINSYSSVSDSITVNVGSQAAPTVDLKINGSDGTVTLASNTSATLSWTSSNASYCYASGDWYGTKNLYGAEGISNIYSSKTYTITCTNQVGASISDTVYVTVSGSSQKPTVDLKINGYDGTLNLPYNNSATLSWNSTNADSCQAYGNWSGTKSTSGSETTGSVSNAKTYTLTCSNSAGSTSDTVSVSVSNQYQNPCQNQSQCQQQPCYQSQCYQQSCGQSCQGYQYTTPTYNYNYIPYTYSYSSASTSNITVTKQARNLSDGVSTYSDVVVADPDETVVFLISVRNSGSYSVQSVVVKDTLPQRVSYNGGLTVDNNPIVGGDGGLFSSGLNIGDLSAGQTKVISFQVKVADISQFSYGQVKLINTVVATASNGSTATDSAAICITRKQVSAASYASIASYVSTGITDNLFVDLVVIPLFLSLLIVFIFKSKLIKLNQWFSKKINGDTSVLTEQLLDLKIKEIQKKEFSAS